MEYLSNKSRGGADNEGEGGLGLLLEEQRTLAATKGAKW